MTMELISKYQGILSFLESFSKG